MEGEKDSVLDREQREGIWLEIRNNERGRERERERESVPNFSYWVLT